MQKRLVISRFVCTLVLLAVMLIMLTDILGVSTEVHIDSYNYLSLYLVHHYEGFYWAILTYIATTIAAILSALRVFIPAHKLNRAAGFFIIIAMILQVLVVDFFTTNSGGTNLKMLYIIFGLLALSSVIDIFFCYRKEKKERTFI